MRKGLGIIGVNREKGEPEIENLLEQIMKNNVPSLVKKIDFQEIQEAQRAPNILDPGRNTQSHIIITLLNIKDKERILKAAREKDTVTYKGVPIRLSADFPPKKPYRQEEAGKKYRKS